MDLAIAAVVAAVLTLIDMDRVFYVPRTVQRKIALYFWWVGFVAVNGALAGAAVLFLAPGPPFKDWDVVVRGLAIGFGYLALIRLKFTTIMIGDKEVPLGIEAAYEGVKQAAFKRINSIAKKARIAEATSLAETKTLAALAEDARVNIDLDSLLKPSEKEEAKRWVARVVLDATTSGERNAKITLADFILSGRGPFGA